MNPDYHKIFNCYYWIFLILMGIVFNSCGQEEKSFAIEGCIIDSNIRKQIPKKIRLDDKSMMNYTLYKNNVLVKDPFPDGIDGYLTNAHRVGDSVNIISILGSGEGFGYVLTITNNTCSVQFFPKSRADKYKRNKNDSLEKGFYIPCKTYKLVLAEPLSTKGTVFEGLIELISDDYYEVVDGKESKCRMELKCYFRAESFALYLPKDSD